MTGFKIFSFFQGGLGISLNVCRIREVATNGSNLGAGRAEAGAAESGCYLTRAEHRKVRSESAAGQGADGDVEFRTPLINHFSNNFFRFSPSSLI